MSEMKIILICDAPDTGKSTAVLELAKKNGFENTIYLREENQVFFPDTFMMAENTISVPFPRRYPDTFTHDLRVRDIIGIAGSLELYTVAIIETTLSKSTGYILTEIFNSNYPLTAVVGNIAGANFTIETAKTNPEKVLSTSEPIESFSIDTDNMISSSLTITGNFKWSGNLFNNHAARVFTMDEKGTFLNGKSLPGNWKTMPAKLILPEDIEEEGINPEGITGRDYFLDFPSVAEIFIDCKSNDFIYDLLSIGQELLKINKGTDLDPTGKSPRDVNDDISEMIEAHSVHSAISLALASYAHFKTSTSLEDIARCFSAMDEYAETVKVLEKAVEMGDISSLKNLFRVCLAWQKAKDLDPWVEKLAQNQDDDTCMLLGRYYHDRNMWEKSDIWLDKITNISEEDEYDYKLFRSDNMLMTKRPDLAVNVRNEMAAMYPDDDGVLYLLGIAQLQACDYLNAGNTFAKALELGNDFPANILALAFCVMKTGGEGDQELIEEATEISIENIEENPAYSVFIENIILSLIASGDKNNALLMEQQNSEMQFSTDYLVIRDKFLEEN